MYGYIFFFKQKTAYDMRISDWSSDVCSSDLVGLVTAGHSSVMANLAGFRLPVQSVPLQALVSEPVKPVLDTVVMSGAVHAYVSQSDKGELVIGAGVDGYIGYGQRGSMQVTEQTLGAICELFPLFRRMRMLRQWRSEEHTSELQSLMRISYAVFCLKKKKQIH